MPESDDDIICLDNTAKGDLTDEEIQNYIDLFVDDEIENGRNPNDLSLKEVIKRINNTGYDGNFLDDPTTIKRICKSLRKAQKNSKNRKKEVVDNNIYNGIKKYNSINHELDNRDFFFPMQQDKIELYRISTLQWILNTSSFKTLYP